jgi:hypothetical protein
MTWRLLVGVLAAAMVAASCGGGDDTAETAAESTAESPPSSVEEQRVDTTPPEPTESAAPESTVPPETAPAEPILAVPDADVITQTTATSGGGTRPLLSWEPVDGAASYLVIVFTAEEAPYWSTITDQPETYVGGAAAIPDGVDGPEVADGYSWAVYADDETGAPIASSPIRPIAP